MWCPNCKKDNPCDCSNCKGEPLERLDEENGVIKCKFCKKPFSLDDSMDYERRLMGKENIINNK